MYIRKVIHTGEVAEVEEYFSNRIGYHDLRSPRIKPTPDDVRRNYERRREKHLRWLLNENFHDGEDALVTLGWGRGQEAPVTLDEIKRETKLFIRRLRKEYEKQGLDLKYVYCVEIGPRGARHIHMVLSHAGGIAPMLLWGCWPGKPPDIKPLYTGTYEDIAAYFLKQYAKKTMETTGQEIKRCYECSRNLKKPRVEIERIREKDIREEIKEPEGYHLDRSTVREGVTRWTGRPWRCYTLKRLSGAELPESTKKEKPNTVFGNIIDRVKGIIARTVQGSEGRRGDAEDKSVDSDRGPRTKKRGWGLRLGDGICQAGRHCEPKHGIRGQGDGQHQQRRADVRSYSGGTKQGKGPV